MINEAVRRQAAEYRSEFRNAQPFPHVVIDDFFDADKAARLLADFPPFDPDNARNEFGEVGRKAVVTDIRGISPFYADVYDYIESPEFLAFAQEATGIPRLVHDEQMFGGGTHENLAGQDLDPHVDFNFIEDRKLHRRLNLLIYLNEEWDIAWGGCLELHSNPRRPKNNQIKVIAPTFNRAVIFETSERSWHGFERIELPEDKKDLSRKMLSIYLYTRDRPKGEIAPPHSTFYVQRPIPDRLVPGHTLTPEDVMQLEELITRRDHWIEFYHRKELSDSQRIQDLVAVSQPPPATQGVVGWLRKVCSRGLKKMEVPATVAAPSERPPRIPISGYAVQEGTAHGVWEDGWIGSPFEAAIRLQTPTDSIVIEGFLPERMLLAIELRVSINDEFAARQVVRPGEISVSVPVMAAAGDLLKLQVVSDASFCPMRSGDSDDGRELVILLREVRVLRTQGPA